MEAKDKNTATATVADELKAQRRNLTADEMKIIYFTKGEIQELETLAKHEAGMDAPRHIVPIFERHMEEIGSLIPDNIELGQDVCLYAFVYDTDIGGMLHDVAQYADVIDDAMNLHNRIAAYGDKWLLIAEGMRRAYWYYHGCMVREMGGKEYADALAANIERGIKTEYIILDTLPQTAGKTDEELIAERGKNLTLLRDEERQLLDIDRDNRHAILDAFMRWHLGDNPALQGMPNMILQSLIGRQGRCLEVSRKRAEAGANGGKKKSKAKADAVRANGKLGGRPTSKPKQNQSKTKANSNSVSNFPNDITSLEDILGGGGGKEPPPPPTKSIEHDGMEYMARPTAQEVRLAAGRMGIASDVVDKWLEYMDKVDWHFSGGDNVTRRTFRQSLSRFAEKESEIKSEVAKPSNWGTRDGQPIGVVLRDPNYKIRL